MIDEARANSQAGAAARQFSPVWTERGWLWPALLLWLGCSAAYFLTAPGRIDIIDGAIRFEVSQSLVDAGVPAVRDPSLPAVPGRDGYRYSWYQLGTSITAVPLLVLADQFASGSREARQFAFSLTSVPFAGGVVALLFLIYGRLGRSRQRALLWSLVVGFGTLLWPYAGSTFDATLQAFWLLIAVWSVVEALAAKSPRWAIVSGLAFAMLINIQETYVILGAAVLGIAPLSLRALWVRLRSPVVYIVLAGVCVGFALVMAANAWRYGHPLETGRFVGGSVFGNPAVGLAGLFFSPAKSIFLYCPAYLLALVGLRRLVKSDAGRFAPLVACVAIHVLFISSLSLWAGEWAWGPRYLVASLPLVCIGLPFSHEPRRVIGVVCGLSIAIQVLAISVDHQRWYFERSLPPFFWYRQVTMYEDSPLLGRPGELLAVLTSGEHSKARALVPGPRPQSMTSSIFGPPNDELPNAPAWLREYAVFLLPRPWTLWGPQLPSDQRPGNVGVMTTSGVGVAILSFSCLFILVFRRR